MIRETKCFILNYIISIEVIKINRSNKKNKFSDPLFSFAVMYSRSELDSQFLHLYLWSQSERLSAGLDSTLAINFIRLMNLILR